MIYTLDEARSNPAYKEAVIELLFQLADDDFLLAYRGSEWLGLAPHIEEDVAFSSISQDTMGHASIFYQLLSDLGVGEPDYLAHARPLEEWRNSVLTELVNGPGTYLTEPRYDWAFTVVRNYFYVEAKKARMESLKQSSYKPLSDAAVKVNMELYYHLLHWKTWFKQLLEAGGEARTRMEEAVKKVCENAGDLFSYGEREQDFLHHQLIDSEAEIKTYWLQSVKPLFDSLRLSAPSLFNINAGDGRRGKHTKDLAAALDILGEVYRSDPVARW